MKIILVVKIQVFWHVASCYTINIYGHFEGSELGITRTVKVKVKCTVVQALRLCTGRTAHRRSRGIALLFLNHGTRRG